MRYFGFISDPQQIHDDQRDDRNQEYEPPGTSQGFVGFKNGFEDFINYPEFQPNNCTAQKQ